MKNTVEYWEKKQGKIILNTDDINLLEKMTIEEFTDLADKNMYSPVDYSFREKWLRDNGYEVTRENMVNADLTPKEA